MSAFGYAWSLPITWQRWRSQHSIRKPHARPPKAFLRNRLKSVKVPPLCTRRPYNINSCELWLLVNYVQITIQSMSALFGRSVHQLSTLSLSFHCNGEIIVIFCLELWTPKLGAPRFAHAAHPLLRHWHWYWRQNNTFIQNTKKRKKTCPSEDKHRTIQNHGLAAFYTVSQKKLGHFSFYCNFVKCWQILIIFFAS